MRRALIQALMAFAGTLSICASITWAAPPGDIDNDCDVDFDDFSAFAACMTGPCAPDCDPPLDPNCVPLDLDGDGDVDLADFQAFQSVSTGADPVPEMVAVYPYRYVFVNAGESVQLVVTGYYPGECNRDVTASTTFLSDDPLVAEVSSDGLLMAVADGETTVRAQYLGLEAVCDVMVTTQEPTVYPESGWIDGIVYDASAGDAPLTGAVITIKDHDVPIPGRVITGPDGRFAFPTPGRGEFFVTIAKNGYTYAQRRVEVTQTLDTAARPVYLLQEEPPLLRVAGPPRRFHVLARSVAGTLYANADNTLQIIWPEGVGGPRNGDPPPQIGATEVNRSLELPEDLPEQSEFTYAYYFDLGEDELPEPVIVRFANDLGFVPGTEIPVGLWDDNLLKWVHEALAVVSEDGQWVEYEADDFSAHDINLPAMAPPDAGSPNADSGNGSEPTKAPAGGAPCTGTSGNSFIAARTGELFEEHVLPSYRSLGVDRTVRLVYQSRAAKPAAFIAYDLTRTSSQVPEAHGFRVSIEGRICESWMTGTTDTRRHAFMWDGVNDRAQLLPTGCYFYYLRMTNEYRANLATSANGQFAGPPGEDLGVQAPERVVYPSFARGTVTLRNDRSSPFGAGWTVASLQRLIINAPQTRAVLTEGNGAAITFKGALDAVAANWWDYHLSLLFGNGDGTFRPAQSLPVTMAPSGVRVGDFDGDGRQDLVVAHARYSFSALWVLLGNGDGTFQEPLSFDTGTMAFGVTVADFNGDGREDLVITGTGFNLLLGNGDGTFQEYSWIDVGPGSYGGVAVGDLNGDGLKDMVVTIPSVSQVSVVLGNGDGTFQSPQTVDVGDHPRGVAVTDLDGDGRQDVITANADSDDVSALLGEGDGTFHTDQRFSVGNYPWPLAVADFNSDGRQDVITANHSSHDVSVLLGNGDGTFQPEDRFAAPVGGDYVAMTLGDIDGDSQQDVVTASGAAIGGLVGVLLGNGDGTFTEPRSYVVGEGARSVAVDDFDSTNAAFISPLGEHSQLGRDPNGTYTRTMKDGTLYHFDSDGFLTSSVDRNSNTITYEYIGSGADKKIWRITDPVGLVTTFTYDGDHLQSVTDPAERTTFFEIDENGDLVQITNPDGAFRTFEYDVDHLLSAQVDAGGTRTEYVYDQYGCVTEVIKAVGTPDEQHRYFQASVNQGLINDLPPGVGTYDNPAPPVNPGDVRSSYTNGEGETEYYETNPFGYRTEIEDPLGRVSQMERDSFNNVTRVTFPRGNEISYEYDKRGNLTRIVHHGIDPPAETLIEYHETWNRPSRIEDPEHHVRTLTYDPDNGNLLSITDPETYQTTFTYNTWGQVEMITNAEGEVVQFSYYDDQGETGNLHQITVDPGDLNLVTTLEYDAYGNVSSVTDAENNSTAYVYDLMNLMRFVTDAESHTTEYQYEAALGTISRWSSAPLAELTKIIDARPVDAATFTYDDLHRLKTETNAISKVWQYTYDDADRMVAVLDPKTQNITYTYDDAGQLTTKTLPTATGTEDVTYEYNLNGSLTRAADADSDLSFDYDTADRLTSYSSAAVAGQPALSLTYTYRDDGLLDTMTGPSGATVYLHNANHWLTQITDPAGRVTNFGYDQIDRRTGLTNHNGTAVTYTFDDASRLTDIVHDLAAVPFLSLTYTHDPAGNIQTMTDGDGLHTYGYDGIYQLTSALHPNPGVNPNESFSYDEVGNRLNSHLSASYAHDNANRLLEDDDFTYTYDDNGNLETKTAKAGGAVTTYTYDAEDRLIRVDLPDASWAEYRYDALARRIEKSVTAVITRYTYDAEDILFEYDGSNNVLARYTHGPGIDEPLITDRDGQLYFYHADHLGTIRTLTDANGAAARTYTYDSFGRIVAETGGTTSPYTFTGREWDSQTALLYYRARSYDPRLGRFLQVDPLGLVVGIPNPYGYCLNNPVNCIDPNGELVFGGGGVLLGGLLAKATVTLVVAAILAHQTAYYGGFLDDGCWGLPGRPEEPGPPIQPFRPVNPMTRGPTGWVR